jgi:hypothetical protein
MIILYFFIGLILTSTVIGSIWFLGVLSAKYLNFPGEGPFGNFINGVSAVLLLFLFVILSGLIYDIGEEFFNNIIK